MTGRSICRDSGSGEHKARTPGSGRARSGAQRSAHPFILAAAARAPSAGPLLAVVGGAGAAGAEAAGAVDQVAEALGDPGGIEGFAGGLGEEAA